MSEYFKIDGAALDRHITGNYGEDQLDRSDHETYGPDEHDEHWLKMAQWQDEAAARERGDHAPIPDRNDEIGIAYPLWLTHLLAGVLGAVVMLLIVGVFVAVAH